MSSKDKHAVILIPSKPNSYYPHIYIQIQETILTGNALERVQRVHEPADLQDITFWTRRIFDWSCSNPTK